MAKDYYKILGVSKNSTKEDIKKAYKQLAKKYHPDSYNPDKPADAEQRFKDINNVYEILSDAQKREQYDEWLRLTGATWQATAPKAAARPASQPENQPGYTPSGNVPADLEARIKAYAADKITVRDLFRGLSGKQAEQVSDDIVNYLEQERKKMMEDNEREISGLKQQFDERLAQMRRDYNL